MQHNGRAVKRRRSCHAILAAADSETGSSRKIFAFCMLGDGVALQLFIKWGMSTEATWKKFNFNRN